LEGEPSARISFGHLSSFTNTSAALSTMGGDYYTPRILLRGSILYQYLSMYLIIRSI
jgi:hypothetical protein